MLLLLLLLMQACFGCHERQVHFELPDSCVQRQPRLLQHLVVATQHRTATQGGVSSQHLTAPAKRTKHANAGTSLTGAAAGGDADTAVYSRGCWQYSCSWWRC
jgi:hypothetical protein